MDKISRLNSLINSLSQRKVKIVETLDVIDEKGKDEMLDIIMEDLYKKHGRASPNFPSFDGYSLDCENLNYAECFEWKLREDLNDCVKNIRFLEEQIEYENGERSTKPENLKKCEVAHIVNKDWVIDLYKKLKDESETTKGIIRKVKDEYEEQFYPVSFRTIFGYVVEYVGKNR